MSQPPPPNPYGDQPPQPPYGQPPLPYGQGYPPQPYGLPQRTSGAAIASLVVGILGICPLAVIGGVIAILLGIIGLGATGKPGVKGRGLAVAGLVLGILSLLGWSGLGSALYVGWRATGPDRVTSTRFVQDLAAGNVAHAATLCQPGTSPASIQSSSDQLKALGAPTTVVPVGFNFNATTAGNRSDITVVVEFGQVQKRVVVTLTPGSPGGTRLVQSWVVQ